MNYFYIIEEEGTGKLYAGSRTARDAHPSDLLHTYHTSSRTVHALIETGSKFRVRKIQVRKDALEYEERFLRRVDADLNPRFLNRHKANSNNYADSNYISVRHKVTGEYRRIHKDDPSRDEYEGVNAGKTYENRVMNGGVLWDGVTYPNLKVVSRETGIPYEHLRNYKNHGEFLPHMKAQRIREAERKKKLYYEVKVNRSKIDLPCVHCGNHFRGRVNLLQHQRTCFPFVANGTKYKSPEEWDGKLEIKRYLRELTKEQVDRKHFKNHKVDLEIRRFT